MTVTEGIEVLDLLKALCCVLILGLVQVHSRKTVM